MKNILTLTFACISCIAFAQPDRWQQKIKYTMNIDMDVRSNQYTGRQKIDYWNNSPDTLNRVFFHLYWNAFQPNSMMDVRSRRQGTIIRGRDRNGDEVADWDPRVEDRIVNLSADEIGYEKIASIKMNGREQKTKLHETILEVILDQPILPKSKVVFDMNWTAQVPIQIRRSGRDNPATQVRYTMTQWYPKMCEYDYEGWHPTPYVAREFYGVWGDFDVTINIDKSYILGGTGYLQNADQIGYGYEKEGVKVPAPKTDKLSWHFIAPNVHDFMWAADPEFVHKTRKVRDSLVFHLLYKPGRTPSKEWEDILDDAQKALPFIEGYFGGYPYKQFSFIHGGDGGMEYPMATLLAGPGAWLHEWLHNWYYGMLGTNESEYAWMDEGFTEFATDRTMAFLMNSTAFPHSDNYGVYFSLAKSGREEPLTTHADHYNTNMAYGAAVYSKGCVFLSQLGYVIGEENLKKTMLEYYRLWRFKHPNVNDFVRVAEKISDMKLDWYREYWINTTKTINYSIDSLWEESGKTKIRLKQSAYTPMPIDFQITFKDGSKELHYIPMYLMFGQKPAEDASVTRKVYEPWKWTHPTYIIETTRKLTEIATAEIDPSQRLADTERKDNKIDLSAIK